MFSRQYVLLTTKMDYIGHSQVFNTYSDLSNNEVDEDMIIDIINTLDKFIARNIYDSKLTSMRVCLNDTK